MIVRLSHPWKYHHVRDLLDTEAGDLTEIEARHLINGGYARDVEDLMAHTGGGWYEVDTSKGPVKVQGREAAFEALRADALP